MTLAVLKNGRKMYTITNTRFITNDVMYLNQCFLILWLQNPFGLQHRQKPKPNKIHTYKNKDNRTHFLEPYKRKTNRTKQNKEFKIRHFPTQYVESVMIIHSGVFMLAAVQIFSAMLVKQIHILPFWPIESI